MYVEVVEWDAPSQRCKTEDSLQATESIDSPTRSGGNSMRPCGLGGGGSVLAKKTLKKNRKCDEFTTGEIRPLDECVWSVSGNIDKMRNRVCCGDGGQKRGRSGAKEQQIDAVTRHGAPTEIARR
ncbi:unnamed protein product [Nippostrongylus brasiliensis]|uniref:Uncharacterized protein n=1 Tax=Nippostrongylus brasiliensis TaxID=27835 RepID=A0A0N4YGJ7_NIPBR|nr:hypothetical protein Q1695_000879 [Nippostrongylus brasiliensis]VDL79531.1 unnamed protein product [Nippostrongylus brasiliensis]